MVSSAGFEPAVSAFVARDPIQLDDEELVSPARVELALCPCRKRVPYPVRRRGHVFRTPADLGLAPALARWTL